MQRNPQELIETDVLIVGGGPAGSTAATLLTRRGWRVFLAEKEFHPRFHIGESLLPMSMPIFDRLGVSDAVRAIGVVKLGADFPAANAAGYNVFRFANMLRPVYDYAYQVKREELDQLLFEHARAQGVQAVQGCRVDSVEFDGDRSTAQASLEDGAKISIRARYVLDASGRNTFLGTRLGLKKKHDKHQSAALFAHFHNVERRPGADAGNISIYQFENGWVWVIPLRDEITSVGAVCNPEYLKQRKTNNAEFLLTTLRGIPGLADRLSKATVAGNVHATGNYSYICSRWTGKGWLMIGDACAFLDPIFSTGVYLAMRSAERASDTVDAILREPRRERALQRKYRSELQHGLSIFSWFIFRFTTPAMAWLFANPRNVFGLEQAVVSMLAGDIFENRPALRRLRIFRGLYLARSLRTLNQSIASLLVRRRRVHAEFSDGTTKQDPR
jgi:flavin-dependent dehydrogenase